MEGSFNDSSSHFMVLNIDMTNTFASVYSPSKGFPVCLKKSILKTDSVCPCTLQEM